jgi:hypothetical protein
MLKDIIRLPGVDYPSDSLHVHREWLLFLFNSYCWTLQASHISSAFLMFLPDFSAILFVSSVGIARPSFLHT